MVQLYQAASRLRYRHTEICCLQALFELEFEPEPMPEIDCESDGHRLDPEVWSYGRESSWETFLSKWGQPESVFTNALELLHISRETVEERDTCDPCKI